MPSVAFSRDALKWLLFELGAGFSSAAWVPGVVCAGHRAGKMMRGRAPVFAKKLLC